MNDTVKTGIGQDSHSFDLDHPEKPLRLGGVTVRDGTPPLKGNSDADVVLHALTNAISGISGINILGERTDVLCAQGLTDSRLYVKEALATLKGMRISHVSIIMECLRPRVSAIAGPMRKSIARILGITPQDVGITATSGEELTPFGQGLGIQVFCVVTAVSALSNSSQ